MAQVISEEHIKIYRRRWIFAGVLVFIFLLQSFNFDLNRGERSAARINIRIGIEIDFDLSPFGLIVSPILACLALIRPRLVGFRKLVLVVSAILLASSLINLLQILTHEFYICHILLQEFAKASETVSLTLPPVLAVMWFPESQIGRTMGALGAGGPGGKILASLLSNNYAKNVTSGYTNSIYFNNSSVTFDKIFDKNTSKIILILFACLSLFIVVFSCLFIRDTPPSPPSTSQMFGSANTKSTDNIGFKQFFYESKNLVKDLVFIFCGLAFALMFGSIVLQKQILQELISDLLRSNETLAISHVMTLYSAGSIAGSVVSGIVLDQWKRHKAHASVATALSFICCLFVLLALYMKDVVVLCVGLVFLGITSSGSLLPLLDSILQHHYPTDPLFLLSWLGFKLNALGLLLDFGARMLLAKFGPAAVLILQSAAMLSSFVFSILSRPELRRLEREKPMKNKFSEKDFLLK